MYSVGVSGTDIICHMTPAIEVKVINHIPLFHKFVIIPNLTLNILGREQFKYNIADVEPSLWSQFKDE